MRKGKIVSHLTVFVLVLYLAVTGAQGIVRAGETTELSDGIYNYTINADGKTATLTKYIGSAADVTIPETVGDGLTVTTLGGTIFKNNKVISSVIIPKTVTSFEKHTTEFYGASNLTSIMVDEGNSVFYSINGVLLKKTVSGNLLVKYPEGKKDIEYIIPKTVKMVNRAAFQWTAQLAKITVPDTVEEIWLQSFTDIKAEIVLAHKDSAILEIQPLVFNHLQSGSKIIVRNDAMKEKVLVAMNECAKDVQVINLDELSAEEQKGYLIPTTSLTWDGTNTTGSTTLKPGEKCQLNYQQVPADSTDNVRWSSSDPAVAKVDAVTGLIEASGGVNYGLKTGTTTITGTDESGHSITLEVTVYKEVESMDIYCDGYNPATYTVEYNGNKQTKWIQANAKPYSANNAYEAVWTSSNTKIATVEKDTQDRQYALLTILSPGTTTITATLNDNGTIFTKSFILTVTGTANSGAGTGDNGSTNEGTTPGNTAGGNTAVNEQTKTQDIKTYIKKGKIAGTTITLTYGTTATIKSVAKGHITYSIANKKVAALTSSGKLTPKNTGVTTLKVKAGAIGKYKGYTITYQLIVLPKKESITYAKSLKAKQLTIKWKKDTKATGYQIQYSTSSKFTGKATKTILVKKNKTTKQTIKKLSGGKKYYVRVRAYKTMKINGKKTNRYGAWSTKKVIKVKKK